MMQLRVLAEDHVTFVVAVVRLRDGEEKGSHSHFAPLISPYWKNLMEALSPVGPQQEKVQPEFGF